MDDLTVARGRIADLYQPRHAGGFTPRAYKPRHAAPEPVVVTRYTGHGLGHTYRPDVAL